MLYETYQFLDWLLEGAAPPSRPWLEGAVAAWPVVGVPPGPKSPPGCLFRTAPTPFGGTEQNITLNVNGTDHAVELEPDSMLLYALRNDLGLRGPKFGCGPVQCGACAVLMDGNAIRSCVTPVSAVGDAKVVTLEGLGTPERPAPTCRPRWRRSPQKSSTSPSRWARPPRPWIRARATAA